MRYYDVFSKSMTPGYPEDKWHTKAKKSMLCPGCITPLPVPSPIDVVLDPEPDNVPLHFVTGALIGFARKYFIEALGKSIQENFWLGKVYGAAGQEYSNFLTFLGKEVLFIRGNHKSTYRRCEVCGRHLYHPMGTRYL